MKKVISLILTVCLTLGMGINAFALTDTYIFSDPVINTYIGQTEAKDMIKNINFTDISGSRYQEDIVRMGAFDIVKGYYNTYSPSKNVTNQDVIAFLIRSLGREANAQQNAAALKNTLPDLSLVDLWSVGYLQEAFNLGIITNEQYQSALVADQSELEEGAFIRSNPATREDIAMWVFLTQNYYSPNEFPIKADLQKIYTYSDFGNIAPDKVAYVETVTANGIMNQNTTAFNPKGTVTRGEMADILSNIDSIYLAQNNLEKKTGTVGGTKAIVNNLTDQYRAVDQFYIRDNTGNIDVIEQHHNNNISPQVQDLDVVVFKNGKVGGLSLLKEGDQIEYIVETTPTKNKDALTCYYIEVTSPQINMTYFGKLTSVDSDNKQITITENGTNLIRTLYTTQNLFGVNAITKEPYMIMDKKLQDISKLPYGSGVNLTLVNNIVIEVSYVGEPTIINEVRGIVVENNPNFGYMVIYNNDGTKTTYNYDIGSLQTVKKLENYQSEDEVGYIDQIFANGGYNPVNSTIDKIEPGDIVFIRPLSTDPTYIESISASTNYTTKSASVISYNDNGDTVNMLVQFNNGTQSMYTFPSNVIIMKEGVLSDATDIVAGSNIKFLVNTAIISPGYVIETVKEIAVEGDYSNISAVVKGQIANFDSIQKNIQIQNSQILNKTGWSNYNQVSTYSLKNSSAEIYYNGSKIDFDYASKYLKRGDYEAYVAIENSYSGQSVKRVSIYNGRDTLLPFDTIVTAIGDGSFITSNNYTNYGTDNGTIVVKNGKLVSPQNISSYDYAQIALNGGNKAAVVNITDRGNVGTITVARGRVQSVDDGNSFTVESLAMLFDGQWSVSAVSRTFNIDNKTIFLDKNGEVSSIDNFLAYTADSVTNSVYNVISDDGVYADYIISAPYAKQPITGTVYGIDKETGSILLKDVNYLNMDNKTWKIISAVNNTCVLKVYPNTIAIKNDKIVTADKVEIGDKVKFYTTSVDYNNMKAGMDINGYIIEVTN